MKLCVLGGGGVRSCFLAKSIACNAGLANLTEVVLMDVDQAKLDRYGKLARQIAIRIAPALQVTLTRSVEEAVTDADFVITTIRSGGDHSRVRDEEIVSQTGLLAQETTGACGFAMAMRSIPVLLDYCEKIKQLAHPGCLIFNFTNPSGIVTQALNSCGYPVYGICDAPSEFVKQLAAMLNVAENRFSCECFGLNHLSWFTHFQVDGKDVTEPIFTDPNLFVKTEMRLFEPQVLKMTDGCLPNEYLYFYYYTRKVIQSSRQAGESRAQLIERVNTMMNKALENVDPDQEFEKAFRIFFEHYNIRENHYMMNESGKARVRHYEVPSVEEFLSTPDEGGYAGVALRFVKALFQDEPVEMILSVPNRGAIAGLRDEDVVEISCRIDHNGAHPIGQPHIPQPIMNLIQTMKEYERTAVRAILNRDRDLAVKALLIHPLVANLDLAEKLVDAFLKESQRDGMPPWK